MTDPTVQPDPWLDIADELERIAEDCRSLVGVPAPFVTTLNFQPGTQHPGRAAQVDAIGEALLGKPGAPKRMLSGSYHQDAQGLRGQIQVHAFVGIPMPNPDADELARLRAENETLKAKLGGLAYSRPADDPQPSAGRIPPHFESGRDLPDGPVCQGVPDGFEADCGTQGGHGPHPLES